MNEDLIYCIAVAGIALAIVATAIGIREVTNE